MSSGDIHGRDFVPPATVVENGTANGYSFQEQQLQAPGSENGTANGYSFQEPQLQAPVQTNGSVQNSMTALQDHTAPAQEAVGETQKHTYASIVRINLYQL